MKQDVVKFKGQILEALGNAWFTLKLESGQIIKATISGKIRINNIKIAIGDNVEVDVSPYDILKGRITRRL